MGQRTSKEKRSAADDVKRQVDGKDNTQKPIYQLVNFENGGGRLIEIIKSSACRSIDSLESNRLLELSADTQAMSSSIDKQIHDLVEPLLYNHGEGKLVSLDKIWQWRFGEPELPLDNDDVHEEAAGRAPRVVVDGSSNSNSRRLVCWKLEERGFVGETALHICFLLTTPTHMVLARKLLSIFPKLINDIYTCDKFFGESPLHMAIVNENVGIVKQLLDRGSDVHLRCLGSFFMPDDQMDSANGSAKRAIGQRRAKKKPDESLRQSRQSLDGGDLESIDLQLNHFASYKTNYNGYAYWGEFPLSFAACLGLADCYKLLLAKGANPNRQDSNGNTTLHMTVIANRKDMFDLCYSNGASLTVTNKQNLSPLTLAAKLKRVELFFHIITIQRQVNWIFCNVGFFEQPLVGLDSIKLSDGSCDDDSVLSIVVFGDSREHLQMLDGLLSQLLKVKWETAAKGKFKWCLYQFLLFLLIASLAYVRRFYDGTNDNTQTTRHASQAALINTSNGNLMAMILSLSDSLYRLPRLVIEHSEKLLIIYAVYYLWFILLRTVPGDGLHFLFRSLVQAPEISLFTCTCIVMLSCVPLRALAFRYGEDVLVSLVMFTLPLKLLFFCRASTSVGSFVVMIYKIVVDDILCSCVFLIIFVAGFSQSTPLTITTTMRVAFLIIFKSYEDPLEQTTNNTLLASEENHFSNLFDGIISMHMMANNEFSVVFDQFEATNYSKLAKVFFCVYMVMASILLVNMMIAMLGKTYQDIASQPNENLRQWARALLTVERMWTKQERLQVLDRYARLDTISGGRYYGSTWPLKEADRELIRTIRKLKEENKLNAIAKNNS